MKTVDDEILANALKFCDKARENNKPFFLWLNPTRMHVVTHLSEKYEKMRNSENGWSEEEAGMAQLDDIVGEVMKYLKDNGLEEDTIIAFSTDNGAENFTWPDGGQTPFAGGKGTGFEGGFRVPASSAGPARFPPARWRTASSPVSTGSPRSSPLLVIPTSSTNCSRESNSATRTTRSTSTVTTRWT